MAVGRGESLSASESSDAGRLGMSRLSREGCGGITLRVLIICRLWLQSGSLSREGKLNKEILGFLSI